MSTETWDRPGSPYHPGEQLLHRRLGRLERQERLGRHMYRSYLPAQHREFYAQLPFLVLGGADPAGWPWATMVFGRPGFVRATDPHTLRVGALPLAGDPLLAGLTPGAALGGLGIELTTRRRNRVNGVVHGCGPDGFALDVVQTFGNCPQYIHGPELRWAREPSLPFDGPVERLDHLDPEAVALICGAERCFVASSDPAGDARDTGGADVNHRGGPPGFVQVRGGTLTIPDYPGNNAFNTLGNLVRHPRAGLLFVDLERGDLLQLSGRAELLLELSPDAAASLGASRAWQVHVQHVVRRRGASPLRYVTPGAAPA